jgi:hypothetical protein
MEVTYEAIEKHLRGYFDALPKMELGGPKGRAVIEPFFSPRVHVRVEGEYPVYLNIDTWLNGLSRGEHKYIIYTRAPIGYVIIDDRKRQAVVFMREDVQSNETGEIIRVIRNNAHFALNVENGVLKFTDELITRIPGKYQLDYICPEWAGLGVNYWEEIFPQGLPAKDQKITYEQMEKTLTGYFDYLPQINKNDLECRVKLASFLSNDFKIRHQDWPNYHNKEQWIARMFGEESRMGNYKWVVQYNSQVDPLYPILPACHFIDDRQKMGAAVVIAKLFNRTNGVLEKQFIFNMHFVFTLEDNAVKIRWQLITRIPGQYMSDTPPEK